MRELNTTFPCCLSNRIDIEGIRDAYQHIVSGEPRTINSLFMLLKMVIHRGRSGINKKDKSNVNIIDPYLFLEEIIQADH